MNYWSVGGTFGLYKIPEDLLEIIGHLLQDEDRLNIRTEETGFGAVLRIGSWNPDLIVLDFVMPGMDGFEVCKRMKSDLRTCDIPIMALTALCNSESKKAVLETGVSAYLTKPFQSDAVLKSVRELLGLSYCRNSKI